MSIYLNNIMSYIPELILLVGICVQGIFQRFSKSLTIIFLCLGLISLLSISFYPNEFYIHLFKILICLSSGMIYCLSSKRRTMKNIKYFNFIRMSKY